MAALRALICDWCGWNFINCRCSKSQRSKEHDDWVAARRERERREAARQQSQGQAAA